MADATVKLDPEEVKTAIAAAVTAALTPEAMQEVVAGAVAALMAPRTYGDKKAAFHDMFKDAVKVRVTTYINELLEKPGPMREQLDGMVIDAMKIALGDSTIRNMVARNLANAIGEALSKST